MTKSEIIQTVRTHFEKWNWEQCRALESASEESIGFECLYRRPDGHMCGVGCLLEDHEVPKANASVKYLRLPERLEPHRAFIIRLQKAHDNGFLKAFLDREEAILEN